MIFFTSGRAKRISRRLNPRSKLRRRRRKGAFARRFRLGKIRIEVLFFDTQPEIRLISKEISRIHFRVARAWGGDFGQATDANSFDTGRGNCLKPVEDRKTHASAHKERKYETRSNHSPLSSSLISLKFMQTEGCQKHRRHCPVIHVGRL